MADQSKTEQATPRRREKAREQGQVARSRDLIAGLSTMAAVMLLAWQLPNFASQWKQILVRQLDAAALHPSQTIPASRHDFGIFRGVALAAGLSWMLAVVAGVAQGGIVFAPEALSPKLERLNPASHLEQLFSLTALSRMLKTLLPTAAIVYLAVGVISERWLDLPRLLYSNPRQLASFLGAQLFAVAWKAALVMLVWSAADYFLEQRRYENQLKMSRQDLKDEFKETEGNPALKQRIRRLQRQVRRRQMLKNVEQATVVVTNPTQFAIALKYAMDMAAPIVVAKGRNLLAAEIKDVARWHAIPIVENPPLAHALYRAVEVGQAIPPKLYAVVAEILAAIWRAQARASAAGGTR